MASFLIAWMNSKEGDMVSFFFFFLNLYLMSIWCPSSERKVGQKHSHPCAPPQVTPLVLTTYSQPHYLNICGPKKAGYALSPFQLLLCETRAVNCPTFPHGGGESPDPA